MSWCGYCHDSAAYFCPNEDCDGSRMEQCTGCADKSQYTCPDCGTKLVDEEEFNEYR